MTTLDLPEQYNIFTDETQPTMAALKEVYQAYIQVRKATDVFWGPLLTVELDRIHNELQQRVSTK